MSAVALPADVVDAVQELAPLLRRCVDLQADAVARLRVGDGTASALVRLPFGVLVGRAVGLDPAGEVSTEARPEPIDIAVRAGDVLAWLDGDRSHDLPARDHEWRTGVPPRAGWRRVETVPDDVIRPLVRQGALALKDAAAREGVPGAQPRAEVADALLDSVVLTVDDAQAPRRRVQITLRALSALTRMGFLTRGGPAHVDVAGRWIRVVGGYGTVYLERPGAGLDLRPAR